LTAYCFSIIIVASFSLQAMSKLLLVAGASCLAMGIGLIVTSRRALRKKKSRTPSAGEDEYPEHHQEDCGCVPDSDRVLVGLSYENRTAFAQGTRPPLPALVVTGFLGSGKTTLLKHILENKQNLRVACAVNDFAELNVDARLIADQPNQDVIELTNGCLCCSLKDEFESSIASVLRQRRDLDYLVVETSGVPPS